MTYFADVPNARNCLGGASAYSVWESSGSSKFHGGNGGCLGRGQGDSGFDGRMNGGGAGEST